MDYFSIIDIKLDEHTQANTYIIMRPTRIQTGPNFLTLIFCYATRISNKETMCILYMAVTVCSYCTTAAVKHSINAGH